MTQQIKFADELLLQFDQLNSELTDNAFRMGDLCVNVCDEYGHIYQHSDILRAIADNTGMCYDTLRDRERVARAVSRDARMEIPLSFHQWRSLVRKDTDPLPMAYWALTGGRDGGIATVKEIQHRMGKDPELPEWLRAWNKMKQLAGMVVMYDDTPASVYEVAVQVGSIEWHPPLP
jgi:hypothetical protein